MIGKSISAAATWLGDLSADIFWDTVTSYPAISVMGVVAGAAFAVSHTPWVERVFPLVSPYVRAAAAVCLVSSAMLMFAFGFRVADGRAEIERLKNDLAWSEFQLGQQRAVADDADRLKSDAEARAKQAKDTLDEYCGKFGCDKSPRDPPPGYIDWLHGLQRHRAHAAGTHRPQRGIVARLRAIGQERR